MRVLNLLAPATLVAGLAAVVSIGCGGSPEKPNVAIQPTVEDPNVPVGEMLFAAKAAPKVAGAIGAGSEPLVMGGATVQFDVRQQLSAEVDGKIEVLGVRDDAINPTDPLCVYHPRDTEKKHRYRRLKEGANVTAGDIIVMMDDQIVVTRMNSAKASEEAAGEVLKSANEGVSLSKDKVKLSKQAWENKSGSFVDYLQDQITLTRFEENRSQALQAIAKAKADYSEAFVMTKKHQISSVVTGFIRTIVHHPGDFVKAGEKILEIQSTEVVRLEGSLDVQYASFVHAGKLVAVEPAIPSAPAKSHKYHQKEITGVAVSSNPGRPLVVSASVDGTARVWDVTKESPLVTLAHPVPVRSVACSPAGSAPVAITGGDDGKLRLWNLANPDALAKEPKEADERHAAAVGAIAFSPDGKFFATAAGREVFVWSTADLKKLYSLPAEHRDSVTALHVTPQCTLVTASKDRTLKVWKLGTEKAGVMRTIDHRSGIVESLGVTSDGGRVVFDQDKDRLDLVSLADRSTFGQVQNSSATAAFATLAVFNPTDTMLATAGGDGELKGGLQVWNIPPAGGRGSEVARLFTPNRVPATAAAFSPSKDHPFLVVGTNAGGIHLWKPPAERKPYTGKIVFVESSDANKVNVRVEMPNPKELNLLDRSTANVIINP
jgi:WD40 repeat protein